MEEFSLPADTLLPALTAIPEALQVPTKRVSTGFLLALTLANSLLFMCYIGIGGPLLPLQMSTVAPANEVANLGIVTSISVLLALIGHPLAGALSERTTSRFGRRRPWLFVGTILSALALAALIISINHSYLALYATGAVIAVSGILSVFPIRSVR